MSKLLEIYKKFRTVRITAQILVLLLVYFAVRYWQSLDDITGPAPVFEAVTLNNKAFSLKDYQGQPVLLHFWAPWCPICRFENSNIDAVAKDYPVITVSTWTESKEEIHDYINKHNLTFPVVYDKNYELARDYSVKAVPMSFFIDSSGMVRHVERGYTSELGLRTRLWWME